MATLTLYNTEDFKIFVENIDADFEKTSDSYVYHLVLNRNDFLKIFENGFDCYIRDGKHMKAEIVSKPIFIHPDQYKLSIETYNGGDEEDDYDD